jgi:hypothetical protein
MPYFFEQIIVSHKAPEMTIETRYLDEAVTALA